MSPRFLDRLLVAGLLCGFALLAGEHGAFAQLAASEPPLRIEPAFAWEASGDVEGLGEVPPIAGSPFDPPRSVAPRVVDFPAAAQSWRLVVLPESVLYSSYMAGVHESRLSGVVFRSDDGDSFFDVTLGGRFGLIGLRTSDVEDPWGWQIDLEGAAFPRLNLSEDWDVDATDFRFGVPLTYAEGPWRFKFSYYHLSSHMGDEFATRNPGALADRINYSRDALVGGVSFYPTPAVRLYAEADWAFHFAEGALPWEFQFGVDYAQPGPTGICGTPFFAVNGHIREAVDFGGNVVAQTGWLWRGKSGRTVRVGAHYYNGKTNQFEFFDDSEQQIGLGIWYDQ